MKQLAIITGTSSGIGAGLAQTLLNENWLVLGLARRETAFESPNYSHLMADLSDLQALEQQIIPAITRRIASEYFDRVALVNNAAAIGSLKPVGDFKASELTKIYAVNVLAPTLLMGAVAKLIPESTDLRILNLSTGAAHRGIPGLADYAGSKAALRLSGMTLAAEFEQAGRSKAAILSYEPGIVDTEMQVAARTPSPNFPSQELFQAFYSNGSLQPVEAVMGDMLAFLQGSQGPPFSEKRFSS